MATQLRWKVKERTAPDYLQGLCISKGPRAALIKEQYTVLEYRDIDDTDDMSLEFDLEVDSRWFEVPIIGLNED